MTISQITTEQQILLYSREQFVLYGFNKVTVDEICDALRISKKTMYQYFSSKEELVNRVVELTLSEFEQGLDAALSKTGNTFLAKLQEVFLFIAANVSKMISKPFINDLQTKLPHLWTRIEQFRQEMINTRFDVLIREGIEQGLIRGDLNKQLFILMYLNCVQTIVRPDVLIKLPLTVNEVFDGIFKTFFIGVLTDEARMNFQETNTWS